MKIGWHTWEPALSGGEKLQAAGGGAWVRLLFDYFRANGHTITWLGHGTNPVGTESVDSGLPDVSVFYWRWEMPNYPERQLAYLNQNVMLERLARSGKKVVIFDGDHKIKMPDFSLWSAAFGDNIVWAAPELNPKSGFVSLHYPFDFVESRYSMKRPLASRYGLVYVGNMYERVEQAASFVNPLASNFEVSFYGDWLSGGENKPSPSYISSIMPDVQFSPRVEASRVIDLLSRADSTIHLFKPSYGSVGFMTYRWVEAVQARTPAFIPSDFYIPESWRDALSPMIVSSGEELRDKFSNMAEWAWSNYLQIQSEFVKQYSGKTSWLELLNGLA